MISIGKQKLNFTKKYIVRTQIWNRLPTPRSKYSLLDRLKKKIKLNIQIENLK